jgi:hypothetical protein
MCSYLTAQLVLRNIFGKRTKNVTDVLPMGGTIERYRRFVVDGVPVATGIVSVGDSWACTNPSLGRGSPWASCTPSAQ